MSIITKPQVTKGASYQFTLNKSELASLPLVIADSYFSQVSNWYRVDVVYKSFTGNQYEIVEFDAQDQSPIGNFSVSSNARDSFLVQKITIIDFDGGFFEIQRSELPTSDFDISFQNPIIIGNYAPDDTAIDVANYAYHYESKGQSFTLSEPMLVSSIKVKIRGYGNLPYIPPQGTLSMKLKKSDFLESGEEVVSSNTLDLQSLSNEAPIIYEFVFNEPVLLQVGTNSIKFKFFFPVDADGRIPLTHGLTTIYGHINSYLGGVLYSENTRLPHVDYWFQIIGTSV
jgi:hypothetical protein